MLIGTVIMSFDLNQIYEDPHSYDVYNPDLSLSSVLAGSDQFGPVMCPSDTSAMWYPSDTSAMWCPSDTSATLQHPRDFLSHARTQSFTNRQRIGSSLSTRGHCEVWDDMPGRTIV